MQKLPTRTRSRVIFFQKLNMGNLDTSQSLCPCHTPEIIRGHALVEARDPLQTHFLKKKIIINMKAFFLILVPKSILLLI